MSTPLDFPSSVDEFIQEGNLDSSNIKNPLFKLAAVNMLLTRAIQGALNTQSDAVRLLAMEMDAVGKLSANIQSYRQNKTSLTDRTNFGKDNADAERMLAEMAKYDVPEDLINQIRAQKNADNRIQINDGQIDKVMSHINAYSESLNTRNSQEQLTLQSLTSKYTQAGEQASNVLQKDAQSKTTIINNSRGLS